MNLEISQLKKYFGRQQAIKIDHLLVDNCQTLVFIGPSGGGKSTLLKLIAGLHIPDSGTIKVDHKQIVYQEKELLEYRRKIGVVFQSWNLFPHLTALENIVLPLLHVHGHSREESNEISLKLLKQFQLDKHADKKPYALSGGQVQRVALIRAIAIHPTLLLLDEPTSALDPLMTAEVLDLILELKNEKRDLILVTHHLQFAKLIAEKVLFISEGHILENGTIQEVFENPNSLQAKNYMSKVLTHRL
ncbi:MAG: amino acid ABC transporter ATP-binding protein [Parachlamydiaceae bacterium]|nr:amino acid ABC transporter ATP-binding protein [Parachlamydiaceae bacterium]